MNGNSLYNGIEIIILFGDTQAFYVDRFLDVAFGPIIKSESVTGGAWDKAIAFRDWIEAKFSVNFRTIPTEALCYYLKEFEATYVETTT